MISEDTVAIVKQVFVLVLQSSCLTQLLQRPGGTRMGGDIAMDQSAAAVLDHHKHVQESESGSDGDEEITGNDPLGVQAQERRPAHVPSRPTCRSFRQILAHRSGRVLNSELYQEFIGDALLAPREILVRHPVNQGLNLKRNRRSTRAGL